MLRMILPGLMVLALAGPAMAQDLKSAAEAQIIAAQKLTKQVDAAIDNLRRLEKSDPLAGLEPLKRLQNLAAERRT